ncbi:MAG TPA: response regulator, partial [Nannocystaceae bacterium]|nr:response regulator [Nannocystaceae bacterium]
MHDVVSNPPTGSASGTPSGSSRPAPTILVVDDEASIVDALTKVLEKEELVVVAAKNGHEALEILRHRRIDVMITDLRMPSMGGDDLLKAAKAIVPDVEVIVMTAYGTVETAVDAMKRGAYDFIPKPLKRATVLAAVRKALDKAALLAENSKLRAQLAAATYKEIVGTSQVFRATLEVAR